MGLSASLSTWLASPVPAAQSDGAPGAVDVFGASTAALGWHRWVMGCQRVARVAPHKSLPTAAAGSPSVAVVQRFERVRGAHDLAAWSLGDGVQEQVPLPLEYSRSRAIPTARGTRR